MKAEKYPQLEATPKRTPAKRMNLSCVAIPTGLPDEQERRCEKLCKVLEELKIDWISVRDAIKNQLVSVLARGHEAFAVEDDDVRHTT